MRSIKVAIIWIIFWGWICNVTSNPSTFQIILFIIFGIGGPVSAILSDISRS